jgi:hypothetical protein
MMESLGQYLRSAFVWFRSGGGEDHSQAVDRSLRTGLFWFWICAGILLAFNSFNSYGSGLGAIYFGFYFSIYAVWRLGKKFWLGKVQLQDFAVFIYVALLFVVADVGSDAFKRKHEANFAPLFAGLEQYRNTIGRYPDELNELVPEFVTSLPECAMTGRESPVTYYAQEDGDRWAATSYGIKCTVGGFIFPIYGMYESEDRTWIYNDSGVVY